MSANQAFEASRVEAQETSSTMVWTGRIISGLVILFLAFDGIGKVVKEENAVQGAVDLGHPESLVIWIGLALTVCTVLYAIPRTAILGAILLTGSAADAPTGRAVDV